VVTLIEDLNGNHVIQKCLRKFEPKDNQFIYDAVAKHCIQVRPEIMQGEGEEGGRRERIESGKGGKRE
jgi:hypothetical protein